MDDDLCELCQLQVIAINHISLIVVYVYDCDLNRSIKDILSDIFVNHKLWFCLRHNIKMLNLVHLMNRKTENEE